MPEAYLAAKPADQVQTHRQHYVDADDRDEADLVGAHVVRTPVKPCGRTINSAINARKAIASRLSQEPMNIVPYDSTTPSTRLATSVPRTLPRPPRTMIANAL